MHRLNSSRERSILDVIDVDLRMVQTPKVQHNMNHTATVFQININPFEIRSFVLDTHTHAMSVG